MVLTQVTILADSLRVKNPVVVGTLGSHFGPTPTMVAVLAHPVGIVGLLGVGALGDHFTMLFDHIVFVLFNFYSLLVLIHQVDKLEGLILTYTLVYVGYLLVDLLN